jgi:hypothetical protein
MVGGSDCKVSPSGRGELSNDLVSHISFKLEQKKKKTTNFFFFFLSFLLLELLTEKIPRLIDTHLFLFFLSKITFLLEVIVGNVAHNHKSLQKKKKKKPDSCCCCCCWGERQSRTRFNGGRICLLMGNCQNIWPTTTRRRRRREKGGNGHR